MAKGKIKFYELERGYGSVIDEESNQALTFYANDIVMKDDKQFLVEGAEIIFNIERNRNVKKAINIMLFNSRKIEN